MTRLVSPVRLVVLSLMLLGCVGEMRGHRARDVTATASSWQAPLSDPASERLVGQAVAEVAAGRPDCARSYDDRLHLGPALWRWLTREDPKLTRFGKHVVLSVEASEPMGFLEWEMRLLRSHRDTCLVLVQPPLQSLTSSFLPGTVRAAREDERLAFFRITPVDLRGKPLVVVERGPNRLVALIEGGRVSWLELLSGWYVAPELLIKDGQLDTTWRPLPAPMLRTPRPVGDAPPFPMPSQPPPPDILPVFP